MEIHVMRHGHVERDFDEIMRIGEAGDPGLSPKGREQVEKMIPYIAKEIKPNSLYFSPTRRARETAKIIFEGVVCIPNMSKRITELKDVGLPIGNNLRALLGLYKGGRVSWQEKWLQGWPPVFETTMDFISRTIKALEIIKKEDPIGPSLIVAHEETIWACRYLLNGVDFKKAILESVINCQINRFLAI